MIFLRCVMDMLHFGFSACVLLAVLQLVYVCQPPDCENVDCGSCGTSCCMIEFKLASSFEDVNTAMVQNLKKGGADGRYTYVNEEDYRKDKIPSGVKYQMQAIHTTLVHHYNDTLNFLIRSNSSDVSFIEAFSISRVYDAFCDEGQNYKNLVGFVKGLKLDFEQRVLHGCKKTF